MGYITSKQKRPDWSVFIWGIWPLLVSNGRSQYNELAYSSASIAA